MQGKRTNVTKVALEKLLKHGLSPIIFAVALALGLIAVNYVIAIKTPYFDVTKNKTNTLSKQTQKFLSEINFDVSIKAFYTSTSQRRIGDILDKYTAASSHIKVELIDPLKNPLVAEKYDVKFPQTIIFEGKNNITRINPPTVRYQQHGEREITLALFRLMNNENKTIYFSTGHGELNISNTEYNGLSTIKKRLEEQNYLIETINLLEAEKVPDNCTLLIIPGPTVPFIEEEELKIKRYVDNEGSILLMVAPGVETKLDRFVASYGLLYGNDFIYETSKKLTTDAGGPIYPLCEAKDKSDVTAPLENQTFMFPYVRSINTIVKLKGINYIDLIASSSDSWAETDMEYVRRMKIGQKPVRDENERKGPLTVVVATEREFDLPDSLATRNANTFQVRSAFTGNAAFISNEVLGGFPSNLTLFLNLVNWMTRNEKVIEITPHAPVFTPVELRPGERSMLNWLTLVIFPGALLSIGLYIWYRRR
ncbi:GldG family protein [bacterium]|nr:GldG family protein [bacterium]